LIELAAFVLVQINNNNTSAMVDYSIEGTSMRLRLGADTWLGFLVNMSPLLSKPVLWLVA